MAMTLKDCTKDELIFVIERLKFYELTVGDYYIQRALFDVEERRNARLLEKSKLLLDYAHKKLQERNNLLAPYEGCRYIDIPDSVLEKAGAAEKEYLTATEKWNKLMGIS